MNCLRCNTPNEEGAKFCKNCGAELQPVFEKRPDSKTPDILLITFIGILFITAMAQFAIRKFVDNWYESPTKYIQGAFWILHDLSFLLIPLSMKNLTLKVIAIIITSIIVIYYLFNNIQFMVR